MPKGAIIITFYMKQLVLSDSLSFPQLLRLQPGTLFPTPCCLIKVSKKDAIHLSKVCHSVFPTPTSHFKGEL